MEGQFVFQLFWLVNAGVRVLPLIGGQSAKKWRNEMQKVRERERERERERGCLLFLLLAAETARVCADL